MNVSKTLVDDVFEAKGELIVVVRSQGHYA